MSQHEWAALTTFIFTGLIAIFVLAKGAQRPIPRFFVIHTVAISAWSFSWYKMISSLAYLDSLFWARLLHFPASFIPATFLHFVQYFLDIQNDRKQIFLRRTYYGLGALFAVLCFMRTFSADVIGKLGFRYYLEPGPYYVTFFFAFIAAIVYINYLLVSALKKATGSKKTHIAYILPAYVLAYAGGAAVFLPAYHIPIPSVALYTIPLCHLIIAYAILRHKLMDIKFIIQKTLLYSVMSAGLASVYTGIATLLARLLERHPSSPAVHPLQIFQWIESQLTILFAYSCIATSILSVSLGLLVWVKGLRKPVHKLWMIFCVTVGLWSLGYGMMIRAETFGQAYWWQWLQYVGSIMIPVVFLHFVILVSGLQSPRVLLAGYIFAVFLQLLNVAGMMISVQVLPPFNYYTKALVPFYFFTAFFLSYAVYAHILLLRRLYTTDDERFKNQIKFILLGTAIGFCGGSTSFFLVYDIPIFPYGVYAVPIYVVTVSYAIYRHQLMDINVVFRKTLLYSLVSASLAAVYVGTITVMAQVLGGQQNPAPVYSSALAAIFITLLFNPLRIRTQHWIDRYFPRERLDPGLLQEAAGGFAHEMKRPLSKISLPAEMALMDLARVKNGEIAWNDALPKVEERLRFIMNQSIDAGYMIEAIRELTMSSSAPAVPASLQEIVEKALGAESALLEKRDISVQFICAKNLPLVLGKPKQLEIVFINLIKNAVDAMSELPKGQFREMLLEVQKEERHVIVHIKDSGLGIGREDLGKIFQPNYTTKGPYGTGMGLYLTSQIIQAHGGTIEVSSQLGSGTTFTIRLPLAPE